MREGLDIREMKGEVELAIVGGGISGISASIYAKRAGLEFQLFEKTALGGQLAYIDRIDNYIGLPLGIKGETLLNNLTGTVKELGIKPIHKEIKNVEVRDEKIYLYSDSSDFYIAKTLIIATGASFKKLGIQGEAKFSGKGVSYCAVCDGFFFKSKEVAVVGGGNTAVEEAIYLSSICKKVYLIHRRNQLRAVDRLQKEIFKVKNIEIIWNTEIREIRGKEHLEELILFNSQEERITSLPVNGLFIAVGIEPNTITFKELLVLDNRGFVVTDENLMTSLGGVFACGDCRQRPLRQLITAASEGAMAAMSVYRYLKGSYISA